MDGTDSRDAGRDDGGRVERERAVGQDVRLVHFGREALLRPTGDPHLDEMARAVYLHYQEAELTR